MMAAEGRRPYPRDELWEGRTAGVLLVASFVFVALSTLVLADNDLREPVQRACTIGMLVLWAVFLLDFLARLCLTRARRSFLARHLFEALSLVLPFLRAFLVVQYLWRLPRLRYSARHQRLRFLLIAAVFGLVFVYVASTLVYVFESASDESSIVTFGDALWWGFVTICTVGYGDYTPVTIPARVVAVALMLGGIAISGIVTATIVSSISDHVQRNMQPADHERSRAGSPTNRAE